jgi:hypothetical protein
MLKSLSVQITKDELQTAMTFLKDQLGEDELRLLLERMDAFSDDAKVDVKQLMTLADGVGPPERAQRIADQPFISSSSSSSPTPAPRSRA